jgi:hypothetical protein
MAARPQEHIRNRQQHHCGNRYTGDDVQELTDES